ncbi:MAG TPA: hypothetical protein VL134_01660 [Leptolyngbya sp.]|nr:hypothetical protein [Leptolyngbya sp.]
MIPLGTQGTVQGQSFNRTIAELEKLMQVMRQRSPKLKISLAGLIFASGSEALTQQFNQRIVE